MDMGFVFIVSWVMARCGKCPVVSWSWPSFKIGIDQVCIHLVAPDFQTPKRDDQHKFAVSIGCCFGSPPIPHCTDCPWRVWTPWFELKSRVCAIACLSWLVVWNGFYFSYIGNNHPNWLVFFRRGWNHQPASVFMFPSTWHGDMDLSRGLTPGTNVWISGDPGRYTCHCSPTVHHPLGAVCPEIAIGGTAWRRPWHLSTLKRGVRRDVASSAADPQDVKSVGIWRDVKDYITSTLLFWPSFRSLICFGVAWLSSPTVLVAKLVSRTAAGSSMESQCLTSRCAVVVFSLDVYPKNMGYSGETFVWCPMKLQGAQGHPCVTGTVILHTKRNTLV